MSAVEIEGCLFDPSRQVRGRGAGIYGRGIETFVAQQLRQLDQLTRMLTQPGEREGMPPMSLAT
jgi:hypothetical protein